MGQLTRAYWIGGHYRRGSGEKNGKREDTHRAGACCPIKNFPAARKLKRSTSEEPLCVERLKRGGKLRVAKSRPIKKSKRGRCTEKFGTEKRGGQEGTGGEKKKRNALKKNVTKMLEGMNARKVENTRRRKKKGGGEPLLKWMVR